jgi:hypothetical protein
MRQRMTSSISSDGLNNRINTNNDKDTNSARSLHQILQNVLANDDHDNNNATTATTTTTTVAVAANRNRNGTDGIDNASVTINSLPSSIATGGIDDHESLLPVSNGDPTSLSLSSSLPLPIATGTGTSLTSVTDLNRVNKRDRIAEYELSELLLRRVVFIFVPVRSSFLPNKPLST